VATPDEPRSDVRRLVETIVLVLGVLAFILVSVFVKRGEDAPSKISRQGIGIFVAAGLTLIMYSFLYRDNPLFKIAENLYVGVGLGYSTIMVWHQYMKMEVYNPLLNAPTREALLEALRMRTIPIILGILLLTRLSRRYAWLSRYAYGLMIGWFSGVYIPFAASSFILRQLEPTVRPLGASLGQVLGTLAILIGTVSVLFYFFFSVEHKGAGGAVSRVGIWFLMVSFGASFGYTVMGRLSLFVGRAKFLLTEWLGIPL
jgi:hypothetical protein